MPARHTYTAQTVSLLCMYALILSFWLITAVSLDGVYKRG